MKRYVLGAAAIGCAVLCLCPAGRSQSAPTGETRQQRGKRVVYEGLKALGGDSFRHMEDRVETGRAYSFYQAKTSGTSIATIYTRYLAPVPGKVMQREREAFGKDQDSGIVLFTETQAWEVNFHGARPMEKERFANYQDSVLRNIFYILRQRLDEPGLEFYSQGTDMYERVPVELVDITDAAGATVTVSFSQFDKLPLRQVFRRRNQTYHDFDTDETTYAKYRDVGGIKWPYDTQRHRNGDKIYEMYASSVEINKGLRDDLFTLPANVKTMK